jgi:hypothetical protein
MKHEIHETENFLRRGSIVHPDAHKYSGSLKSSMGSGTQIYSCLKGNTRIPIRLSQLRHHSQPHLYINKLTKQVVIYKSSLEVVEQVLNNNRFLVLTESSDM